ncbi:hypothetical protein IAU59_004189 [Kwoniella sp. CBS 9459]
MPGRPADNNPWNRRVRRIFWLVGTASTVWFVSSYIMERLKEARVRAIKEKKQKDLMKNHFTSLISTISFTLYALLPTLQPQVFDAYPVESTCQALQGISNSSSLDASTSSLDPASTAANGGGQPSESQNWQPEGSLLLQQEKEGAQHDSHSHDALEQRHRLSEGDVPAEETQSSMQGSPEAGAGSLGAESWASEFTSQRRSSENTEDTGTETETESEVMLSSVGGIETDDGMSSVASQSISLPPTDTSSTSPSPPSPSDLTRSGQFQPRPSPPRAPPRSKKELWRDLKIQSFTWTLTTIYILPMLYLLTSSQLSILARQRYMADVKSSLPPSPERPVDSSIQGNVDDDDDNGDGSKTPRRRLSSSERSQTPSMPDSKKKKGWFSSFSVDSMGLSEFVESSSSFIPNPLSVLPTALTSYLPSIVAPAASGASAATQMTRDSDEILALRQAEEDAVRAEAERLFLTYSWWLLNEGWKAVGKRVEESVEKIFGNMPLKRELSMQDWEMRFKEVRAEVEMELTENSTIELYDFTPHILPDTVSNSASSSLGVPFPRSPSDHSPYLVQLVQETRDHLSSPDGRYLIEKGISTLLGSLLVSLKGECYGQIQDDSDGRIPEHTPGSEQAEREERLGRASKRLVDCLPGINNWGKSVWEGIPDSGVEAMLSIHEFEGFAALVFGDWAPKVSPPEY